MRDENYTNHPTEFRCQLGVHFAALTTSVQLHFEHAYYVCATLHTVVPLG